MTMRRPTYTITWVDEMSVGIPEIDEDHKHFISLMNELNRSITQGNAPTEIKQRLQVIIDDAVQHFAHEERLFKEWQYPDVSSHAKIHAHTLKELNAIMGEFVPYGLDSAWVEAGTRIKSILINHILTEDMKYAEFYRNRCNAGADGNVRLQPK